MANEFIDLKTLVNLKITEQIKIKKDIINKCELDMIPTGFLPDINTIDYYFISYSHQDYKKVQVFYPINV